MASDFQRRHYETIARMIKNAPSYFTDNERAAMAYHFANEFSAEGGYDRNGNRRFKRERFLRACGVEG